MRTGLRVVCSVVDFLSASQHPRGRSYLYATCTGVHIETKESSYYGVAIENVVMKAPLITRASAAMPLTN